MANKKEILLALALTIAVFSFLGIPVPDWLSSFVNSAAGTITAIAAGFSKLVAFIQIFIHF